MEKESVLIIVGIIFGSLILLGGLDYVGVPIGKGTGYQTGQSQLTTAPQPSESSSSKEKISEKKME